MDIKKRAQRNSKVRGTITEINKTVAKLERMKEEYKQKAIQAKQRGDSASYQLAKHGLNATLSQLKRAQEMLLNIEITAELQRMGETNADFLSGMSTIAKRISKINKQSDFVKLQKEIDRALSGMEEAQAGLDGFLSNSEAAFAAISSSSESLTDEEMDRFIDGRLSEKQLLMDDEIERLLAATGGAGKSETPAQKIEVPVDGHTQSAPNDNLVAKPFPGPSGVYDFSPVKSTAVPKELISTLGLTSLEEPSYASANGQMPFVTTPHILVCGEGSERAAFIKRTVTELISSFTANELKISVVDLDSLGYNIFDGAAHCAANVTTEAVSVTAVLDALIAEADKRYGLFAQNGVSNIAEYNYAATQKLPFVIAVFDGCQKVRTPQFDRVYASLARQSRDCGIFTVVGMTGAPTPAVKANTTEVAPSGQIDDGAISRVVNVVRGGVV
ncbi:MAG: hypothetical protein HDT28_06235 [Clostridiales bacterium]|nr:hypothetical protein [Clostridiales bacterium]